ncbi:MAG TPA: hypothetical protein VME92_02115 [Acetobacteraceae bacterium]|nr:hypothetical protein [Acetobacteraceae bacterium]
MTEIPKEPPAIACPSAQPDWDGAQVFGVQTVAPGQGRRVGYLTAPVPVTPELLAATGNAQPAEVLRIAAPCMGTGCQHFDGSSCRLATRVATMMEPVVAGLPRCAIRPVCRWFRQEGKAACLRCPQIVTTMRDPTEHERLVATGVAAAAD